MAKIRRRISEWRAAERGFTSAAIFILALPLLAGALGYGIDMTRVVYVKKYVQDRADLATSGSLSMATTSGDQVVLGQSATDTALSLYCGNTAKVRSAQGLLSNGCSATATVVGAPLTTTGFCNIPTAASSYGVTLRATETVPMLFLKLIGIHEQKLTNISSSAFLRARNC